MDWHWDEDSGRRVPTRRSAYLDSLAGRVPERVLWVVLALALWSWGIAEFVTGSYYGGGASSSPGA